MDIHSPHNELKDDPRVRFAAERTLLAWIRTALGIMAFGFVVARIGLLIRELQPTMSMRTGPIHVSTWVGTALLVLGAVFNFIAVIQYRDTIARLDRGEVYVPPKWSMAVIASILLTVLGIALAIWLTIISSYQL